MGSESDDIDAGWDEVPASSAAPSADVPVARSEPPFESVPVGAGKPGSYTSSESLSPSEVVAPESSVERGGLSRIGPIATIVALAAASIVWLGRSPKLESSQVAPASQAIARAVPAGEPALQLAAPPPVAPAPPAAPPTAVTPPARAERLELEPLVLEAPTKTGVTVRSIPDGAIFFEAGQRVGVGTVKVHVPRDSRVHLTALLNGYQPLNFKVDGKRETLTVRLTPVGAASEAAAEPAPAPAPVAATPAAAE